MKKYAQGYKLNHINSNIYDPNAKHWFATHSGNNFDKAEDN